MRASGIWIVITTAMLAPNLAATHSDGTYDQPVWFHWGPTYDLDILVVPPGHGQLWNGNGILNGLDVDELDPYASSYIAAVEEGIADWRDAIATYDATLNTYLNFHVYVVGRDPIPAPALADPEILIVADETKGVILGQAIKPSLPMCIVDNSMMFIQSFTATDMYNVNAHEVGHCLGQDHVSGGHPTENVLVASYHHSVGNPSNHRHCMDNLNVQTIAHSFFMTGSTGTVATSSHAVYAC
jgi:hypothetical protein